MNDKIGAKHLERAAYVYIRRGDLLGLWQPLGPRAVSREDVWSDH